MKIALRAAATLLTCTGLTACVSLPPATSLSSAVRSRVQTEVAAWLPLVEIADPELADREQVEASFTLSMERYVEQTQRFRTVGILPGAPGPDDLVLKFRFERFRQTRKPHPAYFPGAVLTATLYIWAGGPIFVDETDLQGTLTVLNSSGITLGSAVASRRGTRNTGFWSSEFVLPSGIETRTALIGELLGRALYQLSDQRETT